MFNRPCLAHLKQLVEMVLPAGSTFLPLQFTLNILRNPISRKLFRPHIFIVAFFLEFCK